MRLRYQYGIPKRIEWPRGYHGRCYVVIWEGQDYIISAGLSDSVMFYRDLDDPHTLYVLTQNYRMGYCGLERLYHADGIDCGDAETYPDDPMYLRATITDTIFVPNPDEVKDTGKPLMELAQHNVVRYLAQYLNP